MFASVIINVPNSNVDQKYTYLVPNNAENIIKVGSRVKVPFGNADRTIMGYVLELLEEVNVSFEMKEILEVLDIEPVLSNIQIELANYIKYDALSPYVRILNMMIPKALRLKTVKYINIINYNELDAELALVFQGKQTIEYNSKYYEYNYKILKEKELGNIEISYDVKSLTTDKVVDKYYLNMDLYLTNNVKLSEYVADVLRLMIDEEPLTINEIVDRYELSHYMVRSLIKKGLFKKTSEKVSRTKERNVPVFTKYKPNDYENYESLYEKLVENKEYPHLWIPKDNKETEIVLLKTIKNNIVDSKNTLIICSDILSTYKYSSLIRKETGTDVLCINSTLNDGELLDSYSEIKENKYNVYVTTSVGSLLPYQNIGTIIMLNSESDNYFNDQSPRFDLKKVMIKYSKLISANLIMHSLSPTVKEYCRGLDRKDGYYIMIDNRDKKEVKNVEVIDLKEELLKGNNSYVTERLIKLLRITKAKKKQSVLVINNKNYSTSVICRSCGHVHKCPRCDLSLKYNKKNEQLICPACSYRTAYDKTCPNCKTNNLRLNGIGIEKLVEELSERLEAFSIISIDNPTFSEFQDKLYQIENKEVDIIISTDTYIKSIYNKNIGLVGIINIDSIAMSSNYNAFEKAYNLLVNTQELLEHNEDGLMVIQTYKVESSYLHDYITGDYISYLKKEINNRKILKNEPFYFINRIFVKASYDEMFVEANLIKRLLKELLHEQVFIIGPTYNKTEMAAQLIIKHRFEDISSYYQKIYEQYQFSEIQVIFDKYPKYL